jgi:hypothetical protein
MEYGAQNAVVGDQDLPTSLPVTEVPEQALVDEKKMAKYSESAEFKRLKEFLEARIAFYQRYYPNGQPVQDLPAEERGPYWQAACIITKELENILAEYKQAREVVKGARAESS